MIDSCFKKAKQSARDFLTILLLGVRCDIKEIVQNDAPPDVGLPLNPTSGPVSLKGRRKKTKGLPVLQGPGASQRPIQRAGPPPQGGALILPGAADGGALVQGAYRARSRSIAQQGANKELRVRRFSCAEVQVFLL